MRRWQQRGRQQAGSGSRGEEEAGSPEKGAGSNAQGQVGSGWWGGARVRGGVRGGVKGVVRRGGVIPASDTDEEGTGACVISQDGSISR